jgi:hypothetical protein
LHPTGRAVVARSTQVPVESMWRNQGATRKLADFCHRSHFREFPAAG